MIKDEKYYKKRLQYVCGIGKGFYICTRLEKQIDDDERF